MLKLTKKQEKRLQDIYYNKRGGEGAFSSNPYIIKSVYNKKYAQDKLSTILVKNYIKDQYTYQRHRNYRKKIDRNRVYSPGPGVWVGLDLGDFRSFANDNNDFKYLLIACDIFSKMIYLEALKFKDKNSVLIGFKKMLPRFKHKPLILCSDLGGEFLSKPFQQFLKKENIHFVALQGQYHNAVVERQLKTIKTILGRVWTNLGKTEWHNHIQNIAKSYNNTKHSSIKMRPVEVEEWNADLVHARLYPTKIARVQPKFKKNDMVRISLILGSFTKAYEGVFSKQTFLIASDAFYPQKGHLPMYKLIDSYDKTEIPGSFYEAELQKINKKLFKHKKNMEYDIKVIETKGKLSKIHYVGWSKNHDVWIKTASIKTRKAK